MGSFFHRKTKMIKKFLTYYTFPIIFVWLLVVSYNSSKRKPDSVMELITDPSWLYDWPKWLDIPLMKWINDGFKVFNEKYGIYFEVINDFLLGAILSLKKFLIVLPWPLVIALVVAWDNRFCRNLYIFYRFSSSQILG